jgi:polyisoprenoid-binding protein YceI
MATWILEPGHTEAEFRARHMMVTWVRGLFKNIRGTVEWDRESCERTTFQGCIDARGVWTGEDQRDEHLRSADFFDVENHPLIEFDGRFTERIGDTHFKATTRLTLRGTTAEVPLRVAYLGQWETPFWVGDDDRGTMRRIGFEATTLIDRHDFGVSWNDRLPRGGMVVSNEIDVTLDVEAIPLEDLEATGAIDYYRDIGALPHGRE